MIPKFDPESAIYEARRRLSKALGWRKLRNLSLAISHRAGLTVQKEKGDELARDLTGLPPEPWLTASEAEADLVFVAIERKVRDVDR